MDKYLDSHHTDVRAITVRFLQAKVFKKDEAQAKYYGEKVTALFLRLDKMFATQTWIAGTERPSIADLSAWSELYA